jgi:hypothetical protein
MSPQVVLQPGCPIFFAIAAKGNSASAEDVNMNKIFIKKTDIEVISESSI